MSASFAGAVHAEIILGGGAVAGAPPGMSAAPVINIANPNSNGLSHNKTPRFDVGEAGVIFNNSLEPGDSRLAGWVQANPNLSANATVILTEVTGDMPSSINGLLEILGAPADLIIANPNGLTLNGAKTVNVNGFVATTGVPDVGQALTLTAPLRENRIVIGADGFDTNGLSYFDVVARAVELNGVVGSPDAIADVQIIAGYNRYNFFGRSAQKAGTPDIGRPDIAIHGTAAGAMYGSRIRLISTESGAGVRYAGAIRSQGDIVILSSGDIELLRKSLPAAITARGNITLSADERIVVQNGVWADRDVSLTAEADLINENYVGAGGALDVRSQALLLKSGSSLVSLGTIKLDTSSLLSEQGADIAASGDVDITTKRTLMTAGQIDSGGKTALHAGDDLTNTGMIFSSSTLDMSSGHWLLNDEGAILAASDNLTLRSLGDLTNRNGSMISSGMDVSITAGKTALNEQEALIDGANVSITADIVHNRLDSIMQGFDSLYLKGHTAQLNTEGGKLITGDVVVSDTDSLLF